MGEGHRVPGGLKGGQGRGDGIEQGARAQLPSCDDWRMSEQDEPVTSEVVPVPPAADMRYEDESAVARVFVRVDYAGGRVREYEAEEPEGFEMNDPEHDFTVRPMRMAVQAPGSPVMPMTAAVPALRLSFTASPRRSMHIRTERTAPSPAERGLG